MSLARTGFWFGAVGVAAAATHAAVFGLAQSALWPELAKDWPVTTRVNWSMSTLRPGRIRAVGPAGISRRMDSARCSASGRLSSGGQDPCTGKTSKRGGSGPAAEGSPGPKRQGIIRIQSINKELAWAKEWRKLRRGQGPQR